MTPGWAFWRYELRRMLTIYLVALLLAICAIGVVLLAVRIDGKVNDTKSVIPFALFFYALIMAMSASWMGANTIGQEKLIARDRLVRVRPIKRGRLLWVRTAFTLICTAAGLLISGLVMLAVGLILGVEWGDKLPIRFGVVMTSSFWAIGWCTGVLVFRHQGQRTSFLLFSMLAILLVWPTTWYFWGKCLLFPPMAGENLMLPILAAIVAVVIGIRYGTQSLDYGPPRIFPRVLAAFMLPFWVLSAIWVAGVADYYTVRPCDGHLSRIIVNPQTDIIWLAGQRYEIWAMEFAQPWVPGQVPGPATPCRPNESALTESGWLLGGDNSFFNMIKMEPINRWISPSGRIMANNLYKTNGITLPGDKLFLCADGQQARSLDTLGHIAYYIYPAREADKVILLWGDAHEFWSLRRPSAHPDSAKLIRYDFDRDVILELPTKSWDLAIRKRGDAVILIDRHATWRKRSEPIGERFEDIWERVVTLPESLSITENELVASDYALAASSPAEGSKRWYLCHADGRIQRMPATYRFTSAAISPDERWIFAMQDDSTCNPSLRVDGYMTDAPGDTVPHRPLWRPDGRKLKTGLGLFHFSVSRSRVFFVDWQRELQAWDSQTERFQQVNNFGDLDSLPK